MRVCKGPCGRKLPIARFGFTNTSKSHRRHICNTCKSQQRSPEKQNEIRTRNNLKKSQTRIEDPARAVLKDSRDSDKRHSRENDLDIDFVRQQLEKGCSYCNETNIRMTLDRIDNAKGHLKSNVVPACIRCNYARRDMPYRAWMFLVEGMRKAKEADAFGSWTGSVYAARHAPKNKVMA